MPLTRATVTVASRIMLPTYAMFFAGVGLSLILTPGERLVQTPAFLYADRLISLTWWGIGYLVLAVVMLWAMAVHSRMAYRYALSAAFVWMASWAALSFAAALDGGQASFSAWTWPAFVAVACWATLASLAAGEK